ncbi:efflux RND transporter periplasmic adaptor subunit [bacterium]|nr:efflux RND transporter periplasmic adaptor subunit [bacterium]
MKKNVFRLIGIIVLLFLLWRIVMLFVGDSGRRGGGSGRPPVAVEVDSIRTEPIREIREFTGTVFPKYQYIVAPKVSGRILEIRKRIGDWVAAGEVIARIDDAEYQQAVLEADASLRIAKATLAETHSQFALVKQELERVRSLQEKGIASPSELDAALTNFDAQESRLKLAEAQVEQREAALQSSKIRLGYTILSATEPGFVGERYVDEGSLLSPNTAVVKIIGIDDVIVRTTIIERDYGRIRVSQEATVEVDAFPAHPFGGRVARIAPMLQETSRMADMEIEVKNDSLLLKPGMFTRVYVVLSQKESAVVVPSKAVVNHSGQKGLFVIDSTGAAVRFYEVQTGIVTEERTEIISPPIEGLVVTLGQHLLEDGSPVILPEGATDGGRP